MPTLPLAIDPGVSTGVALAIGPRYITNTIKGLQEFYNFLIRTEPTVIICENFAATVISKYGLYTVELVGAIRMYCYMKHIPVVIHNPQDRYAFMGPATQLLKASNMAHTRHEIDALAHLLRWQFMQTPAASN